MKKLTYIFALIFFFLIAIGFGYFYLSSNIINFSIDNSKSYNRIISLAPSFSETITALGETDKLVGVTIHCNFDSNEKIPKIGSFANPNIEEIINLKPDLVLAVPHVMAQNTIKVLQSKGIEVFSYQPDTLADIKHIIKVISKKLNIESRGYILNSKINKAIKKARLLTEPYVDKIKNKKILITVCPSPLVVAGKKTFVSEILESFGLINMASSSKSPWPIWPVENIISEPPDFLVIFHELEGAKQYESLLKIVNNNILKNSIISPQRPIFSIPSPSLIKDVKYFSNLLIEKVSKQ